MSVFVQEARRTITLATPIIVGQVSQMLLGVTDSIMIGQVGKVPLAASAFANAVFNFIYIIGMGLLIPVAVLVSRAYGARRSDECAEWVRHGTAVAFVFSALATAAMLGLGSLLHRFGQPVEVLGEIHPYYEIIAASFLPALAFQVFRQAAESLGRPMLPMIVMLGSVLLNVALNWILIYGNLGLPALGLAGAGWATLISRAISVLAIAWCLARARSLTGAWPVGTWWHRLSWARVREMLHLGIPAAGSLMFEAGAFTAAALMVGWIGATALAAHQIALSCAAFTFMFPLGLSMAVSMRLARAVGEDRKERVRAIGFGAHAISAGVMASFAILFALAGRALAGAFVSDEEVITLAARLLVVAAIFQLFDGGQVVGSGALRGLADVRVPTVITGIAYWGVSLPIGYFLGVRGTWGAVGVWVALAAGLGLAAISLLWRFDRLTRTYRTASEVA